METVHKKTSRKTQVSMGRRCQRGLEKMKLIKWVEQAQDRFKWKAIVEKAKTTRVIAP
jgi:hypothetical protein